MGFSLLMSRGCFITWRSGSCKGISTNTLKSHWHLYRIVFQRFLGLTNYWTVSLQLQKFKSDIIHQEACIVCYLYTCTCIYTYKDWKLWTWQKAVTEQKIVLFSVIILFGRLITFPCIRVPKNGYCEIINVRKNMFQLLMCRVERHEQLNSVRVKVFLILKEIWSHLND